MKFLTILFSIYIMLVSCLPCTDGNENIGCDAIVSVDSNDSDFNSHSSHEHHHEDTCPPFCICNCCGAQILTLNKIEFFEFPFFSVLYQEKVIFYILNYSNSLAKTIWQPPQFV